MHIHDVGSAAPGGCPTLTDDQKGVFPPWLQGHVECSMTAAGGPGDPAPDTHTGRAQVAASPAGLGLAGDWYATRQPPFSSSGAEVGGMQQQQQASTQGIADELQATQPPQRQQQASAQALAEQWYAAQQPGHSSRNGTEGAFASTLHPQHSMGQPVEEGPPQSATAGGAAAGMDLEGLQQCDNNEVLKHRQQALAEQRRERLRQMADIEQRLQACLQQDFSAGASGAEVRAIDVSTSGRLGEEVGDGHATTWMWPVPSFVGAADGWKLGNTVPVQQAGGGGLLKHRISRGCLHSQSG